MVTARRSFLLTMTRVILSCSCSHSTSKRLQLAASGGLLLRSGEARTRDNFGTFGEREFC